MIDDQQVAEAAHPVRKHHPAVGNGLDVTTGARPDEQAAPGAAAIARRPEAPGNRAPNGQAQVASLPGKAAIAGHGFVAILCFDRARAGRFDAGRIPGYFPFLASPRALPFPLRLGGSTGSFRSACGFGCLCRLGCLCSLGGKDFGQAVDQVGQPFLVLLQVADFLALGIHLA